MTEWDGLVLCKHMVWRHWKLFIFLSQFYHTVAKNLFDTGSEAARKLASYLFLIFCRFHVNNEDTTIVMRHACERTWSIYNHGSETGLEKRLLRIAFFKA